MVCTGGQVKLTHRRVEYVFAASGRMAEGSDVLRRHFCVACGWTGGKALLLDGGCPHDSFPDGCGPLTSAAAGQLVVVDPGHINEDVYPVEQWPAEPSTVAQYVRERALTLLQRVAVVAAGTFVWNSVAAK